jgi:protein Mpv17
MSILNKSNTKETIDGILDKGMKIFKAELIVWTPAYFLNFYFVPLKYRVFFDATISFGFDMYNSYIYYKKTSFDIYKKK